MRDRAAAARSRSSTRSRRTPSTTNPTAVAKPNPTSSAVTVSCANAAPPTNPSSADHDADSTVPGAVKATNRDAG